MVTVNGVAIYKVLKPIKAEWELVGRNGVHGKWCVAEYEIPNGAEIQFIAKARGKEDISATFVVGEVSSVDYEGYSYNRELRGWIVSIG
jgi:hypothetical protein